MVDFYSTGISLLGLTKALVPPYLPPNLEQVRFGLCYANPGGAYPVEHEVTALNGYAPFYTSLNNDFFGATQSNFPPPLNVALRTWRSGPHSGLNVTWQAIADWINPVNYWYAAYYSTIITDPILLYATGQFKYERIMKTGDILEIPTDELTVVIEQQLDHDL